LAFYTTSGRNINTVVANWSRPLQEPLGHIFLKWEYQIPF